MPRLLTTAECHNIVAHRQVTEIGSDLENCFSLAAHRTRRVKRWDGERMILRWTAAALLAAEKTFRRIRGCEQLKDLGKVLRELETTSTLKAA